ncbi:LysR family transcriptional regulator [Alcaligenaceae bacterium]|nr:LysR family transcriptional regulator [Alcaligenaceae bacterium]
MAGDFGRKVALMNELASMQTFIKVVETGSFSAVARHGASVSSVARQVKALEDELGVRLLNRSTRSLSLTEPGRLYYERATQIVRDLANAKLAAKSFQDSVKGVLRVSLRVSSGAAIIPALAPFFRQYPDLKLDISLNDERCDLIANQIDVAVWMGAIPDAEIIARRLSPSRRIVCGAPSYIQNRGMPKTPDDIRSHDCIVYTAPKYGNIWAFTKDGKEQEVEVDGVIRSDNAIVLRSSAVAGLGLIVVHEWMVRPLLSNGLLMRVLEDYTVKPIDKEAELYVVYPSSRGLSRNVRVFVDYLLSLFNGSQDLGAIGVEEAEPGSYFEEKAALVPPSTGSTVPVT